MLARHADRTVRSVSDLRSHQFVLVWMEGRTKHPKQRVTTRLPGGGSMVGRFWSDCKTERRCSGPPYARLLDNVVLGTEYRAPTIGAQHNRVETARAERGKRTVFFRQIGLKKQLNVFLKVFLLR